MADREGHWRPSVTSGGNNRLLAALRVRAANRDRVDCARAISTPVLASTQPRDAKGGGS